MLYIRITFHSLALYHRLINKVQNIVILIFRVNINNNRYKQ